MVMLETHQEDYAHEGHADADVEESRVGEDVKSGRFVETEEEGNQECEG